MGAALPHFPKGKHRYKRSEVVFQLNACQSVRWAGTNAFAGNARLGKHLQLIGTDKSIYLVTKQMGTRPG